jgi:hypothetical protein
LKCEIAAALRTVWNAESAESTECFLREYDGHWEEKVHQIRQNENYL